MLDVNNKIHLMSITYNLTKLYNRKWFYSCVEEYFSYDLLTLIYIDLDNFKQYNDPFGHAIGDFILQEVSKIFKKVIKDCGFVARLGGDEFIMIIKNKSESEVITIIQTIYEAFQKQKGFQESISSLLKESITISEKMYLSCSMGIVQTKNLKSMCELDTYMKKADALLYDIKKSTKGTYSFITI